ncbi:hypothetical protein ACFWF9_33265 [Streptomyces roseolus]|uniref:hypothetical protein n=1 Tax=Streptomyces roseolus TaxID=67358 RepID=UPI003647858D
MDPAAVDRRAPLPLRRLLTGRNDKRGAQADVARRTDWSREQIRQITAQHAKAKKAEAPASAPE